MPVPRRSPMACHWRSIQMPLLRLWAAVHRVVCVNRLTASGRVLGAAERISVADALRTITLGAAYTLKLDHEIGSIEAGSGRISRCWRMIL